ncbi:aspartate aminotransferase family protein [Clostridium sp.]|uniref:aspartate aminotransferase family protein n=1 Tax=Clostridium sp. TaxID=1506 RepID=UPI0039917C61
MVNKEQYYKYIINNYKVHDIVIEYGKGSYLYDNNKKKYLDLTSGIGVNSLGYCDKEFMERLKNQLTKITHTSNLFINENAVETAKLLVQLSKMDKVFFSNSGAESNECAIKIARKYSYDKYGFGRDKILTLKNSFHGRTLTTLKATGQEKFHKYFYPFPEGFIYGEANNIDNILLKLNKNNVCAIIIEPIQGEGGVFPLSYEFITSLKKVCDERDIILIFDEVQCGIGRTGKIFAFENFDVTPDIVTLAKGLGGGVPIGAVICNKKTSGVLNYGDHGSTYGGNPLVTTAAKYVLSKISNISFLNEINEKSAYLINALKNIKSDNIIEVRGMGLMIGIEVKGNLNEYIDKGIEKGILLLSAGSNTIRLLPPLTITIAELEEAISVLKEIL